MAIETLEDVWESDPDDWIYFPKAGRYGVPEWLHRDELVIVAARGTDNNRVTLHEGTTDILSVPEKDGEYVPSGAKEKIMGHLGKN